MLNILNSFFISGVIFVLIGCSFSQKKVKKFYAAAEESKPYDAIIVPGFPFEENEEWHMVNKMRIYWAHYLYEQGITKNIIFSGSAVYTPYVEAVIMKEYLVEMGVPEENIFTECNAEHSTENVWYSYHFAKQLGFKKLALSSDPFQSKMLKAYIKKKIGKDKIDFIPTVYDELKKMEMVEPKIDSSKAFVPNFVALTERESFFKRFAGTRGKNLDYSDTVYHSKCDMLLSDRVKNKYPNYKK